MQRRPAPPSPVMQALRALERTQLRKAKPKTDAEGPALAKKKPSRKSGKAKKAKG